MSGRRTILCVPGILTKPGLIDNWPELACRWIDRQRPDINAERYEYYSPATLRGMGEAGRAADLATVLGDYIDDRLTLVAHSNGADVVVRALKLLPKTQVIETIHLLSPACEADWTTNGLNVAMAAGRVGFVDVWIAGKDTALGFWARLSRIPPLSWIPGLSYGLLGRDGPQGVQPDLASRVSVQAEPDYGHSTWWDAANFDDTMRRLTA